jgi:uracil-DNA glycosylase
MTAKMSCQNFDPDFSCVLCPRLAAFHQENRRAYPTWFNGPVPSFGEDQSSFLIVGLAPGLKGANRTGRPFTGDHAGHLLYGSLLKYGFASGQYDERPDDGLKLINCRITNAVRCVPPQNKPLPSEIKQCNFFLKSQLQELPHLQVILALGAIAHSSILSALELAPLKNWPFKHGAIYEINQNNRKLWLVNSYHCSKYNTSTKRLTEPMFYQVIEKCRNLL